MTGMTDRTESDEYPLIIKITKLPDPRRVVAPRYFKNEEEWMDYLEYVKRAMGVRDRRR